MVIRSGSQGPQVRTAAHVLALLRPPRLGVGLLAVLEQGDELGLVPLASLPVYLLLHERRLVRVALRIEVCRGGDARTMPACTTF